MDGYEDSRRGFIKKLGLSLGATIIGSKAATAAIKEAKIDFPLSDREQEFMNNYEKWMDNFIEVIKIQRKNPDDLDNNKRLMELSEQAEQWQNELKSYMEDENFARYYMVATERMTKEIG